MSNSPKNKTNAALLNREGAPDDIVLSTGTDPIPKADEAGAILEYSDTGDRFRWSSTTWVLSGGPRVESSSLVETLLTAESVTGDHEFTLIDAPPRNNLVDYFFFVDSGGDPVDATAGTVLITLSPILPLYQNITNGTFNAADARDLTWLKPNGFGKAVSIKITFTGITGGS